MPAEIILQARKENEVVIEGEVHLVINEDTPNDITIEVPNQNGRLLSKEMLSNNTLVSSDTIKRPIILVPENNSTGFKGTFVLSPYETSETYSGIPTGMRIEISNVVDFSTILKNVIIDELLTEVPVTFEESNQVLYARVKYVSDIHVSGYSDVVKFTNSNFHTYKPKILTPIGGTVGVARTPFVQVSDYQYMGNGNYYAGLTYEVATDANFTAIVETATIGSPNTGGNGVNNGVYLNNFIVNTVLNEDTTYYIRCKYIGIVSGNSLWSDTISVKTNFLDEKIYIFYQGSSTSQGEVVFKIIKDGSNFVMVGTNTTSSAAVNNCFIIKLDSDFNIIKSKIMTFDTWTGTSQGFTAIDLDDDGNYIIVGNLEIKDGTTAGVISRGHARSFIIKMSPDLTVLKKKIFNYKNNYYHHFIRGFHSTNPTGYIFKGEIVPTNQSWGAGDWRQFAVLVTDKDLNMVSYKYYPTVDVFIPPLDFIGKKYIPLRNLALDANHNSIYTGFPKNAILKYNTTTLAIELFARINLGSNYKDSILFNGVEDKSGNLYSLLTVLEVSTGLGVSFIIKTDANLNLLGCKKLSYATLGSAFQHINIDDDENLLITGAKSTLSLLVDSYSKAVFVKMDKNLNILVAKEIGNNTPTAAGAVGQWLTAHKSLIFDGKYVIAGAYTLGNSFYEASITLTDKYLDIGTGTSTLGRTISNSDLIATAYTPTITFDTIPTAVDAPTTHGYSDLTYLSYVDATYNRTIDSI